MDALDASHFDELTPQERAVLRLTHERLEQGEIARELGATVDVVKKRATAARRKLGAPSTIVAARLLAAYEAVAGTSSAGTPSALDALTQKPQPPLVEGGERSGSRNVGGELGPDRESAPPAGGGDADAEVGNPSPAAVAAGPGPLQLGATSRTSGPAAHAGPARHPAFRFAGGRNDLTALQRLIAIPLILAAYAAALLVGLAVYQALKTIRLPPGPETSAAIGDHHVAKSSIHRLQRR